MELPNLGVAFDALSHDPMPRLFLVSALMLAGCDGANLLFDPNIATIEAVTVDQSPAGADGAAVFGRLATPFDTLDTAPARGPFPLALDTPPGFTVQSTDGEFWDGDPLTVEVRRCAASCASSEVVGREEVEPNAWEGTERSVGVAGATVTLAFRKTTS